MSEAIEALSEYKYLLESMGHDAQSTGPYMRCLDAIASLQAMQGEAEPVAWVKIERGEITHAELSDGSGVDFDLRGAGYVPLYSHPQPAVPEGYMLVPIDPNKNMIGVIENEHDVWGTAHDLYAALLSAAKGETE